MLPESSWRVFKRIEIDGEKWQRSWPTSPAAAGGYVRVHKPTKTSKVLNGGFGGGKRGSWRVCQ